MALAAIGVSVGLVAVVGATMLFLWPQPHQGCEPFWPTPNRTRGLDLGFLRAHSEHTQGSLELKSPAVTQHFQSHDPRNFAAEVSVAEYSVAFGLPNTDAQNPFYGKDPRLRVIVVTSYGSFGYRLGFTELAPPSGSDPVPYSVGVQGLNAADGTVLTGDMPVCK